MLRYPEATERLAPSDRVVAKDHQIVRAAAAVR
jgi:hypothetical protein